MLVMLVVFLMLLLFAVGEGDAFDAIDSLAFVTSYSYPLLTSKSTVKEKITTKIRIKNDIQFFSFLCSLVIFKFFQKMSTGSPALSTLSG